MASYISFDCNNVQPRSAFYFAVPSCPDSFSGTLHCLIDLRQPIPKRSRRRGHIVIFWMFTGVLKQALLAKISSISVSHLLNFNNCLWHVIFLLQDTRGITWLVYLNGNNAAEGENNIKYASSYPMNWIVKNWFVQDFKGHGHVTDEWRDYDEDNVPFKRLEKVYVPDEEWTFSMASFTVFTEIIANFIFPFSFFW